MTVKVYLTDGKVEEYPNAYIYWEWDENKKGTDSGFRINSMDRNFTSAVAFVHPGECKKIEISSEESDMIFKSPPSEGMSVKWYKIFKAIDEERKKQDEKWGVQNHPMREKSLDIMDSDPVPLKEVLENQRRHCRLRISIRKNWFDILLEKVCETFLEEKPEKQREEMVQVAAVAVQIIEYLDRKKEVKDERQ
jgi:predicted house-cleaning noncanonical NTP pyrophosphatase (MazG superfamily)